MLYIDSVSRGNVSAQNRHNTFSWTVQDKSCRVIKELVVCNSWDLESMDLLKLSDPKLLSTGR